MKLETTPLQGRVGTEVWLKTGSYSYSYSVDGTVKLYTGLIQGEPARLRRNLIETKERAPTRQGKKTFLN